MAIHVKQSTTNMEHAKTLASVRKLFETFDKEFHTQPVHLLASFTSFAVQHHKIIRLIN